MNNDNLETDNDSEDELCNDTVAEPFKNIPFITDRPAIEKIEHLWIRMRKGQHMRGWERGSVRGVTF